MKKLIITLIILPILFVLNLNAQSTYGIKIGGNYSFFQNEKTELKLGFSVGFSREWKLSALSHKFGDVLL